MAENPVSELHPSSDASSDGPAFLCKSWTDPHSATPLQLVLGYGFQTAWKYGLDTSFGFIQTVAAILSVAGVGAAARILLGPSVRPVEPLYNRLRMEGGALAWPHLRVQFAASPYKKLTMERAVILQGRTQEGKTTLLRTSIPWYRRWNIWPMKWWCWHGMYLNGAEAGRSETFDQWLTFQMFGRTTAAGSELKQSFWEYRRSQWLRLFMEKLRVPVLELLPKPMFVIVDQFEELLRIHPDQALPWALAITQQHTRNNVARVIFVVNSENGTKSLLNHSVTRGSCGLSPPTFRDWTLCSSSTLR
eukprot:TRINITY_DN4822_c0_g1_i1.p1 TRINITY_DN4822_c0_g1~~TRINITY_DN4822_c0_g1_i1.p1  ORF type:complete len:304 (-),score=24.25 TRINITY_DN4822_c0_g1_i1:160-1071(-)